MAIALPTDCGVRDPRFFPQVPELAGTFLESDSGAGRLYVGRTVSSVSGALTLAFLAPPAQVERELLVVTQVQNRPWVVVPFSTRPGGPVENTHTLPTPAARTAGAGRPVVDFAGTLPYASELFGVYQPLPGWLGYSSTQLLAVAEGRPAQRELFSGAEARQLSRPELAALPKPPTEGILSPVGLVNLFRQYFFEFDTFLGAPVGHLWLSPGGTVEVVETSTRRTLVERTAEQSEESTRKTEESLTEQTDVADAVKEDNANETSLGVTASAGANYVGIAQADVSTSYSTKNTTHSSSEVTHKHTRAQSSKVSSEITRNFKTTFKTVTETTDTSSRRYVVQNTTDKLVNYELRRKMRKVGIQVQHIGTQLSWQVHVPDPGRALGLGELLDVVAAPDLTGLKKPEPLEPLVPTTTTVTEVYPVQRIGSNGPHLDQDWFYVADEDHLSHGHSDEYLVAHFDYTAVPPGPGWTVDTSQPEPIRVVEAKASNGSGTKYLGKCKILDLASNRYQIRTELVNFANGNWISLSVRIMWKPPSTHPGQDAYDRALAEYRAEVDRLQRTAYVEAVRERVETVSGLRRRPAGDLRKEERYCVFERLIAQLDLYDGRQPQLSAELIRQMFDVDRMLYFVAPDYWRPGGVSTGKASLGRHPVPQHQWDPAPGDEPLQGATVPGHYSHTAANNPPNAVAPVSDEALEWRINYPLTEGSQPAPVGSSLGWLVQIDGDERRNEFLNSSWVKAVLPIRPGHEPAALGWLQQADVEGEAALDKPYTWQTGDPDGYQNKTIGQVLELLAAELQRKNTDIGTTLATETVFETGFDPLDGGFRPAEPYQVFDQWTEVLPTDQVVAVEVEYDPRTGQQR
ncbi:hypothetical protein [Streptomyces sp. NPDC098781]|uniref:hypothetical protein n=1 Tax=Streptomyces sp. NPDC098781 TaxID=3366097 RepID=UPI00382B4464